MTSRRTFTERQVLLTLLNQGSVIPCGICKVALKLHDAFGKKVHRDHSTPLALDGPDTWENCAYVHDTCHHRKTNGSKATTYGSDKHQIAKANRIAGGGKKRRGPKLRGRPFQNNRSGQFKSKINQPTERRP